jgi:hypothetical protein
MVDHGYVHFKRTGVNEWYARESDAELIEPGEIRKFERAKKIQRWDRRRRRLVNRIATRGGHYFPESTKHCLRDVYEVVLRKRT